MTEADFIELVQGQLGPETKIAKSAIKQTLDAASAAMLQALHESGAAPLFGMGSLKIVERAARKGRNPRTGAALNIPAKKTVKYTPSKQVKNAAF